PIGSLTGGTTVAAILSSDQLARDLAIRDLTDPAAGRHAIQLVIDLAATALTAAWGCQVRLARGPRVVALTDNYDALGFPPDAVTRDSRYLCQVEHLRGDTRIAGPQEPDIGNALPQHEQP